LRVAAGDPGAAIKHQPSRRERPHNRALPGRSRAAVARRSLAPPSSTTAPRSGTPGSSTSRIAPWRCVALRRAGRAPL